MIWPPGHFSGLCIQAVLGPGLGYRGLLQRRRPAPRTAQRLGAESSRGEVSAELMPHTCALEGAAIPMEGDDVPPRARRKRLIASLLQPSLPSVWGVCAGHLFFAMRPNCSVCRPHAEPGSGGSFIGISLRLVSGPRTAARRSEMVRGGPVAFSFLLVPFCCLLIAAPGSYQ